MKILLEDHTWPEFAELLAGDPFAVVPVGAVEQHGRHLPLRVDATLCSEVTRRATERVVKDGVAAVLLPTLWAGYSPHHMDFPGTITLSTDTFIGMLIDVARSLHHHGVRRILFVNGHGGNVNHLRSAIQTLRFEHGVEAVGVSYWDLGTDAIQKWRRSPLGGINHACEMETSLMLAVRPNLVDMDQAEDVLLSRSPYLSADLTSGGVVVNAQPFSRLTNSGVIGAPSLADAERGRELLEALAAELAAFITEFSQWDVAQDSEGSQLD